MEWEFEILDFLQSIHSPILTKLMSFVTFLGEAGWFWIILGIFLLCMKKYRFAGIAALTALIFDFAAANLILKPLVARPRPCWINESVEMLVRVPEDYSFPSGHTMASFAAAFISALYSTSLVSIVWSNWVLFIISISGPLGHFHFSPNPYPHLRYTSLRRALPPIIYRPCRHNWDMVCTARLQH